MRDNKTIVIACNPYDDEFFIGCSFDDLLVKFSKFFDSKYLLERLLIAEKQNNIEKKLEFKEETINSLRLKRNEIFDLYITVDRNLTRLSIVHPVYPFHHMWNGYSPWRLIDQMEISDLSDLQLLPMKYENEFLTKFEENKHNLNVKIIKGDITKCGVDAIVNAANERLMSGGGVCGAIFKAAGYDKLTNACNKLGVCKTGESVITKGYNLKSKYIIHTVGPIYKDDSSSKYLESAYTSALELADGYSCKSIALPAISTGIYGYPKDKAVKIALNVVTRFQACILEDVYLVCYDDEMYNLYINKFNEVKQ